MNRSGRTRARASRGRQLATRRRFGPTGRFHYSVLFKNIESKFKAPTYFIPEARFGELVDFLHYRIDNTILGRVNGKRGIPNYESFDEYVRQHMATAVNA